MTVKCIESDSEIPTTDLPVTKNVTSVSLKCGTVNTPTQISCSTQDDHFSTIYIIVRLIQITVTKFSGKFSGKFLAKFRGELTS